MSEFDEFLDDLFKRTPLEEMWDKWSDRWEPKHPRTRYAIYGIEDMKINGTMVTLGNKIPCHLCGNTDRWVIEGDERTKEIRVFVCEHEPVRIFGGSIRQVSTIPAWKVAKFEITYDEEDR